MNTKTKKILVFALIALTLLAFTIPVFAAADSTDFLDPKETVKAKKSNLANSTNDVMNQALGVVQIVAIGVAVIMLIVLAIKYISAAPGEKADIKKGAMIYVVGAVLLFGATGILQIIKTFAQNVQT